MKRFSRIRQSNMGQIRVCIHPEAWELVEYGRDRVERAHGAEFK